MIFTEKNCTSLGSFSNEILSWGPQRDWACQMWTDGGCKGNFERGIYPGNNRVTKGLLDDFQSFICYSIDTSGIPGESEGCFAGYTQSFASESSTTTANQATPSLAPSHTSTETTTSTTTSSSDDTTTTNSLTTSTTGSSEVVVPATGGVVDGGDGRGSPINLKLAHRYRDWFHR
ncbi:hypothetical protein B0H14DRAFT_2572531 [Mycena olivaceomarginata]|nr:hypothetical protein B0H14DRAFT_2572531 [Mycena olivaceomarginata]